MNKRVVVGMSGGVDSSVAAMLLKDQGYDVIGVTMCFGIAAGSRKKPSCCGLEGIEDARKIAHQLDIPHYVLNFGKELEEIVVLDFVFEYICARTPNPCVRCNQYLKFGALLKRAKALGASHVATGHFARVEKKGRDLFLRKGADPKKDQSYFLCQLKRAQLAHVLFPLGALTKNEVRAAAKKRGLYVADKPASQEVCFIPNNDYRAFLRERLNKAYFQQGDIVDGQGKVLGHHNGIFNYTIGQREGLGIAAKHPLYVIRLDEAERRVVVGKKEDVYSKALVAVEPNIVVGEAFKKTEHVKAKIRYNHPEAAARVTMLDKNRLRVDFDEPQAAITPGQFVVFYEEDIVLGAAKIIESI
jgi:tRNA-specific 2-thiouridylase